MLAQKPLIVLTGPTAVGKTELSIKLAKAAGGEIVSADSMQVYKYMDIGSAKIMADEMQGIPHHLIDTLEPDEEFHVVKFQEMAKKAVEDIYSRGRIPIITGGTGFYIQAILKDVDFTQEENDPKYRKQLEMLAKEQGREYIHQMLQKADPASAKVIHKNNVKRVIRALEYYKLTNTPISVHNETEKRRCSPYDYIYFVLNERREELYNRIDLRVDKMVALGLKDEVERLKSMGYHRDMVSMQGLGYKEMLSYLDGELSFEEALYIIKRDTRHFAKRQITWFKREKDVIWLNKYEYGSSKELLNKIIEHLENKYGSIHGNLSEPGDF